MKCSKHSVLPYNDLKCWHIYVATQYVCVCVCVCVFVSENEVRHGQPPASYSVTTD